MTDKAPSIVRSAARVLDLLEFLARQPEGASLTETSAALDLPKSSALMLLRTVVARGYAGRNASDRYALNDVFRTHGFGWGGGRHSRLIALATPVMEALCRQVGETVILAARDGNQARPIAKVVTDQPIRWDVPMTAGLPFYCTAIGRIVVAHAPESERDAMLSATPRERRTSRTVTQMPALRAIVAAALEEGYAVAQDEFALGGTGIAAPIFGAEGKLAAVLNVGCVTNRFIEHRSRVLDALLEAAAQLSRAFSNGFVD